MERLNPSKYRHHCSSGSSKRGPIDGATNSDHKGQDGQPIQPPKLPEECFHHGSPLTAQTKSGCVWPNPAAARADLSHLAFVCQVLVEAYSGRESVTIFLKVIAVPHSGH